MEKILGYNFGLMILITQYIMMNNYLNSSNLFRRRMWLITEIIYHHYFYVLQIWCQSKNGNFEITVELKLLRHSKASLVEKLMEVILWCNFNFINAWYCHKQNPL